MQTTIDVAAIISFLIITLLTIIGWMINRQLTFIDGSIKELSGRIQIQNGRINKLEAWAEAHGKEDLLMQNSIREALEELLRRRGVKK